MPEDVPRTTQQTLLLRPTGVLDSAAALTEAVATAPADALPPGSAIVVDLRAVDTLTDAAANALVSFAADRRDRGIICRVLCDPANPTVRAALAAADPDLTVPCHTRLDDALPADTADGIDAEVLDQFDALTRMLLGVNTVADALEQVLKAVTLVVPHADLVSVTLRDPDQGFHTPVRTDRVADELDQVQYRTSQGPCLDCARPTGPSYTLSDDLETEPRWPQFAAAAFRHGYRSVLALELHPTFGELSGALNIYSRRAHGLTTADRHAAFLLASHASLALAHTRAAELAELDQVRMRRAIDSRDVIGQAKGILMNREGITAEKAFEVLRRTSQDLNVKLVDLARTLTTRHAELDDPPGRPGDIP